MELYGCNNVSAGAPYDSRRLGAKIFPRHPNGWCDVLLCNELQAVLRGDGRLKYFEVDSVGPHLVRNAGGPQDLRCFGWVQNARVVRIPCPKGVVPHCLGRCSLRVNYPPALALHRASKLPRTDVYGKPQDSERRLATKGGAINA